MAFTEPFTLTTRLEAFSTVSVLRRKPVQEEPGSNGAGPTPQRPTVLEEMSAQAVAASVGAAAASVDDASSLLASQDGSSILDPLVLQVAFCISGCSGAVANCQRSVISDLV